MKSKLEVVPNAGRWLTDRLRDRPGSIMLCSAWIGQAPWGDSDLSALTQHCDVTIAFRWPSTLNEAQCVSASTLLEAMDAGVAIRCTQDALHAKLYVVDDHVYVGSANLTGAGIGAKSSHRRNFEAGFLTEDPEAIEELMTFLDALWIGDHCLKCERREVCPDPIA